MTKAVLKTGLILCCLVFCQTNLNAQTLFTYGHQSVSKEEFIKAYRKNNSEKNVTEKSLRDYLELYTRYKLKVRAAYDLKLDTLRGQASELQNFRNQVADGYLNDEESLNKLITEAYSRSLVDIKLAHIYINIPKGESPADTLAAFQKANAAYLALQSGKPFSEVATQYSDDPSVKTNHGEIGYITAFTLPYALENLAYSTPPGGFSGIYRSKSAYHIFQNLGQRKAIGRMRAAQILLSFPPHADAQAMESTRLRADSIYEVLQKGGSFAELAKKFSGDNLSFQTGGEMAEFGAGKYEADFENAAFALTRDGEISKPVLTEYGYHIIKRISRSEVPSINNKETYDAYKKKVITDPRNEFAKKALFQKIFREENFKHSSIPQQDLWAYTDSFLMHRPLPKIKGVEEKTVLISFPKKTITVKNWLDYIKPVKENRRISGGRTDKELYEQFEQVMAYDYYRSHLEDYNRDFAYQLTEFKEGNLLFEIMQQKIWDKASSDSAGLKKYFLDHKDKYWWQSSANAVLVSCSNGKVASDLRKKLEEQHFEGWRALVDSTHGSAQADSGRFEISQLPLPEQQHYSNGQFSTMLTNPNDNTVTFAYVFQLFPQREPRDYNDARGFVINDYQAFLEDNWIADLKKQYPVTLNEAVFKSLLK